ncbi:hypothetical protein BU26DRAFT_443540, partial [Trematosphaeria pertusa]
VRVVICRGCFGVGGGLSSLEQAIAEGENPVCGRPPSPCKAPSTSRVVWECSAKWEVNFF